jgi:hypothetical protein
MHRNLAGPFFGDIAQRLSIGHDRQNLIWGWSQ